MKARMLGLFSGFPTRQFTKEIAERIKSELPVREMLVFISAWPADAERNDCDAAGMHGMFVTYDMPFQCYRVIDNRTDAEEAKNLIREASCIFLMGGHAVQQYQLICEKGIREELRNCTAVILGVSAGSSNMAERALDIWESHVPYEGLGLANITIKAHVNKDQQALLQTLQMISVEQKLPVCAMADESAIFVKAGQVECIGQIQYVHNGEVCPITEDILLKMVEKAD